MDPTTLIIGLSAGPRVVVFFTNTSSLMSLPVLLPVLPAARLTNTISDGATPGLPIKISAAVNVEASILIPWGFIVSIAHFPGADGFDFPSPFDSDIGFN